MFEKDAEEYLDTESKYLIEDNEGNIINITNKVKRSFQDGAEFGYNKCKDKLDEAKEIIEQMKDLFFDCWQERGYEAIKFEQKVNDFLKESE